jgi:hypothetical protein
MRILEVEVDEAVLDKAEQKAQALDTSVSNVVATYLETWAADAAQQDRLQQARQELKARFARRDWQFAVGTPDNREQRNARR